MTTKLTPEHEAWRKKKAEEVADKFRSDEARFDMTIGYVSENSAKAGMTAEHEVARLMGRIDCLNELTRREAENTHECIVEIEAQLARLLAGKENHDHTEA